MAILIFVSSSAVRVYEIVACIGLSMGLVE